MDSSESGSWPTVEMLIVDGRPTVRGDLDLASVSRFESWLASLDGQHDLDLSAVTFFDSSSLRTLLKARNTNPALRIVTASATVLRVLHVTGLTEHLMDGQA